MISYGVLTQYSVLLTVRHNRPLQIPCCTTGLQCVAYQIKSIIYLSIKE